MLKLIVEAKNWDAAPLTALFESVTDETTGKTDKKYFITGPFVQTNVKNRNGRVYPKQLMEACVEKYKAERMNPKTGYRSYGELGHPDGVELNLDKVSHYITELNWDGNDCIGKAKILTQNPSGRIVQTFLDEGCLRIGSSTRGLGVLAERAGQDGSKMVQQYEMIASDIVADPSAPQGFVQGILENKGYIIGENGLITECYDALEQSLVSLPKDTELRKALYLAELNKFLRNM
jgi:hypothetical protein